MARELHTVNCSNRFNTHTEDLYTFLLYKDRVTTLSVRVTFLTDGSIDNVTHTSHYSHVNASRAQHFTLAN